MSTNRTLIRLCFILLLGMLASRSAYAQEKVIITETDTILFNIQPDEEEFRILSEFYKQTGGKKWKKNTNWLKGKTSADMAKWYGVVVRDGDVSEINLDDNNLTGSVPKSLYKLDGLRALSLEGNALQEERAGKMVARSAQPPAAMTMAAEGFSTFSAAAPAPVTAGKNLPTWGLAVAGTNIQKVDWRKTIPEAVPLPNSGPSQLGSSGVAIDPCGNLAFYVLHSGTDAPNQLHIYDGTGNRLTNETAGDVKQALNAANSNIEVQVVLVPGTADEWFIIYSRYQAPCSPSPKSSAYCPARVVYARVKYTSNGVFEMYADKREISISNKTFIHGKAVSRTVNGETNMHYLYLVERTDSGPQENKMFIHRYIIDNVGINFGTVNAKAIPAQYWAGGIVGSSVELSPDETKLAISNRNVGSYIKEDIIVFDLSEFNSTTYVPSIISVPDLMVYGTNKTIKQLSIDFAEYSCLGYLKNKLTQLEFSPSGRYLYMLHGGYPDGTGGVPYNTYLLQVDLQSGTGKNDYEVRMQVENGASGSGCTGSPGTTPNTNLIQQVQSAYDGRLYFTKNNSSTLFVIPHPDDPMPHDMTPRSVTLATDKAPNITMANSAKVLFMPENIDGYSYLAPGVDTKFTLNGAPANLIVGKDDPVELTIAGFNPSEEIYQISWGDGVTETTIPSATKTHEYSTIGEYQVTLTVTNLQSPVNGGVCSAVTSKKVTVVGCLEAIGMQIDTTRYLCALKFSVPKITNCFATYLWDFDDGTTSRNRSPLHVYSPGSFNVKVTISYDCESCSGEVIKTIQVVEPNQVVPATEERILQVESDQRLKILSSAATTFSETWPLDHNEPSLQGMNPFVSGAQGVWRNEGTFVYNKPRSTSTPVQISTDGTYTLEHFNWPFAHLQAIPKWIRANDITRYNAYGFELENEDVLGVNSAALYDHGGQLQTANGVNMRNGEMAFTGFEHFENRPTGNFNFHNLTVPAYKSYTVSTADSYIATVEAPLSELADADKADIILDRRMGAAWLPFLNRSQLLPDVNILCKRVHPTNPQWTVLVFEQAPHGGLWSGEIRVRNTIVPFTTASIDATHAHTGNSSMKISTVQVFQQKLLTLDSGKMYHFSAWVSVNNPHVLTPKLASNLGVDVVLKDKLGSTVSTTFILPEGKIIEGWQQVRGTFLCPDDGLVLSLKFKPGSTGSAWYDDVRLHPDNGNMKSYVYDLTNYRVRAILDENNFASMFYYDKEGNLYLTKKETEEGVKTITENMSYQVERP